MFAMLAAPAATNDDWNNRIPELIDEALRFDGLWRVEHATLPNGEFAYTGTIAIQSIGTTFSLVWDITAGRYVGIGLLHDTHLFVGCGEYMAGLGVAVCTIQPDQTVAVRWSTPELRGKLGTGAFTSAWPGSFEGSHRLRQSSPAGDSADEWTLAIRKTERIYELMWQADAATRRIGLGIPTHDGLAVGWYPDLKQLAVLDYTIDPNDRRRRHATWALGGYTGLDTETLVQE
jgi:hypothetical protein